MSIQTLPPVWQKWTDEDLATLTKSEVWALHAIIENKMYQLEYNFDKRIFFKDAKYAKIFNNHHGETKKEEKGIS